MRIIIAPAKKMIVDTDSFAVDGLPQFLEQTERLKAALRSMSPRELQALWKCNETIAKLNVERLEQMPVRPAGVPWAVLRTELEETARLLAPGLEAEISVPGQGAVVIDHGIFLTAAENLIGNGARFGRRTLTISLTREGDLLSLSVADDGPGFPDQLLQSGPKPFGKLEENAEHFGMGLYTSGLLCRKHGGSLRLENRGGAAAVAVFQIFSQP